MKSEGTIGPDVLLRVRRGWGPLGEQLETELRRAIAERHVPPGARLPASRTLAADLGVSRRLVVEVYERLTAEGFLEARVGAGTAVRRDLRLPPGPAQPTAATAGPSPPDTPLGLSPVPYDFFPGHPDLASFPRGEWGRAVRDALAALPDAALGYGDPRGLPELRAELAALLARSRRVVAHPDRIVVCQGAVQALGLLVRAHVRGARIAVEDPSLPEHRALLGFHGAQVVPVPTDEHGVRDETVAAAGVAAVLLTPAHQMPTGVALGAARRAALVRWARESGAMVVEDDYSAEFRYDRVPPAALQALAPDVTVYLGSASKTLAPALRLAWLVLPEDRVEAVVTAKRAADAGSPTIEQAALARLIASGSYERHVRAARRRQRTHRAALVDAVARHLPGARVTGVAAGLHAVVRLPHPVPARETMDRARERGVGVYPLELFRADPAADTSGLVLGYGALSPPAIEEGVERLGAVLAASR